MAIEPTVLEDRFRNKDTAFTLDERAKLGITGRLPAAVETLDEQASRAYQQLEQQPSDLHKYIYLNGVHDRNQVLYYKITSCLPITSPNCCPSSTTRRLVTRSSSGAGCTATRGRSTCPSTDRRTSAPRSRRSGWARMTST